LLISGKETIYGSLWILRYDNNTLLLLFQKFYHKAVFSVILEVQIFKIFDLPTFVNSPGFIRKLFIVGLPKFQKCEPKWAGEGEKNSPSV
jgi:hypothetical protein